MVQLLNIRVQIIIVPAAKDVLDVFYFLYSRNAFLLPGSEIFINSRILHYEKKQTSNCIAVLLCSHRWCRAGPGISDLITFNNLIFNSLKPTVMKKILSVLIFMGMFIYGISQTIDLKTNGYPLKFTKVNTLFYSEYSTSGAMKTNAKKDDPNTLNLKYSFGIKN